MFRKFALVILGLILSTGICFATGATITQTEYGFSCTGGVDATRIVANTWVTSTAYVAGQRVVYQQKIYTCLLDHTSGTFATDLAAKDWSLAANSPYIALNIKAIGQKANTATDVSYLTSGASTVVAAQIVNSNTVTYGQDGIILSNPIITLGNASDVVQIYTKSSNIPN